MVLGVAITAALLYWVLRDTSLSEVMGHLRTARPGPGRCRTGDARHKTVTCDR